MIPKIKLVRDPKTGLIVPEIWQSIKSYKGWYEISNYGRVKSVERRQIRSNGHPQSTHERILRPGIRNNYEFVGLAKRGIIGYYKIHILVAEHFIPNKIKSRNQVNHKKNTRNNLAINLEWVNGRENTSHGKLRKNKSSKYIGVRYIKDPRYKTKKWTATIGHNNKYYYLGTFYTEYEAHLSYVSALKKFNTENRYMS